MEKKYPVNNLPLYQVVNDKHHILVRAINPEDAWYCAYEGWGDAVQGAEVSLVKRPELYTDLPIGVMKDIKRKQLQ